MSDLRAIARALGGEIAGSQVLAPGPGHSGRDRSLSVRLSHTAPDGFLAFSYAGDPWTQCKDHVRDGWGCSARASLATGRAGRPIAPAKLGSSDRRTDAALATWREGVDPRGTLAEVHLRGCSLDLDDDLAGEVLRRHPHLRAMVALFRNIRTDEAQAVSRTFLDLDGRKIQRKFLGPAAGAAIKLDPNADVTMGLHIGEGVETCLAARRLGLRPAWALRSAGAVATFPDLSGIECLTLLAEHDTATARAVEACGARWRSAGREVLMAEPDFVKDVDDATRGLT
jgi:putative DNA primase/helicase